jgi:hypothetical protein
MLLMSIASIASFDGTEKLHPTVDCLQKRAKEREATGLLVEDER